MSPITLNSSRPVSFAGPRAALSPNKALAQILDLSTGDELVKIASAQAKIDQVLSQTDGQQTSQLTRDEAATLHELLRDLDEASGGIGGGDPIRRVELAQEISTYLP